MNDRDASNIARLYAEADRHGITVETVDTSLAMGSEWHGLYIRDAELGPGIALNAQLTAEWRSWILAHELGHHHHAEDQLFSPFLFYGAHRVDEATKKRWGSWRRLNPEEEKANSWAVRFLIDPDEWEAVEELHPCDIRAILEHFRLPLPAAIAWERLQRNEIGRQSQEALINIDEITWTILNRGISGTGGHQAFFRRLMQGRVGDYLRLSRDDFGYARERAARVQGGWLTRYKALLAAVEELHRSGCSMRSMFTPNTAGFAD